MMKKIGYLSLFLAFPAGMAIAILFFDFRFSPASDPVACKNKCVAICEKRFDPNNWQILGCINACNRDERCISPR